MNKEANHPSPEIIKGAQVGVILLLLALAMLIAGCARPVTAGIEIDEAELEAEERRQLEEIRLAQLRQEEDAFKKLLDQDERLWRMSSKMNRAAVDMCPDNVAKLAGIRFLDLSLFDSDAHDVVTRLGVEDRPKVTAILSGVPATKSGLRIGDVILEIDDYVFEGKSNASLSDLTEEKYRKLTSDGMIKMRVLRSDVEHTFTIETLDYCDYAGQVVPWDDLNAFADGENIYFTRRMMEFLETDTELATVVAHELAHNIMRHIDAKKLNILGGALIDFAIALASDWNYGGDIASSAARHVHSHEFEAEADYVALYIMARAGMKIEKTPEIWRKMSVTHGSTGQFSISHPSNPARYLLMSKAIDEINQKRANGEPLLPNIREGAESGIIVPGYISDS